MSFETLKGVDRRVGEFWHPAGVRSVSGRDPGGVSGARPPAAIWQPFGLAKPLQNNNLCGSFLSR